MANTLYSSVKIRPKMPCKLLFIESMFRIHFSVYGYCYSSLSLDIKLVTEEKSWSQTGLLKKSSCNKILNCSWSLELPHFSTEGHDWCALPWALHLDCSVLSVWHNPTLSTFAAMSTAGSGVVSPNKKPTKQNKNLHAEINDLPD